MIHWDWLHPAAGLAMTHLISWIAIKEIGTVYAKGKYLVDHFYAQISLDEAVEIAAINSSNQGLIFSSTPPWRLVTSLVATIGKLSNSLMPSANINNKV